MICSVVNLRAESHSHLIKLQGNGVITDVISQSGLLRKQKTYLKSRVNQISFCGLVIMSHMIAGERRMRELGKQWRRSLSTSRTTSITLFCSPSMGTMSLFHPICKIWISSTILASRTSVISGRMSSLIGQEKCLRSKVSMTSKLGT